MALFAIADLHLAGAAGDAKSMEVFGRRWVGCKEKLVKKWNAVVTPSDHVVISGDVSWAMTLEEAYEDFALIDSLPGTKYIGKGNHDFWWATASKMNTFFKKSGFSTLNILYNNAYETPHGIICGSRGWFSDEANQKTVGEVDWQKITERETLRLGLSLKNAFSLSAASTTSTASSDTNISSSSLSHFPSSLPVYVFLHFPPVWNSVVSRGIIDVLHEYGITQCYYGHIHGVYSSDTTFEFEGIRFDMISADHLDFCPKIIAK